MRNVTLLAARTVLGGYLSVHGAQKLFGSFGGSGLDAAGATFDKMGLRPGKAMATLAGASELGGGLLTAAGVAYPLGPVAIAGSMAVASAVHRNQGPMAQKGGYELPLTNLAVAALLAADGPGAIKLGPRLPKKLSRLTFLGALAMTVAALAQVLRAKPPAVSSSAAATPSTRADATTAEPAPNGSAPASATTSAD